MAPAWLVDNLWQDCMVLTTGVDKLSVPILVAEVDGGLTEVAWKVGPQSLAADINIADSSYYVTDSSQRLDGAGRRLPALTGLSGDDFDFCSSAGNHKFRDANPRRGGVGGFDELIFHLTHRAGIFL